MLIIGLLWHIRMTGSIGKKGNQLEKYIKEHSDTQFSHGFCEECLNKYYPEDEE